ncbi:MAG: FAD-dependent oxidoreductase [Pseudomonadota bacterium]
MSRDKKHLLVLGAGIVGVASALRGLRAGLDVTLVDRLPPGDSTSFGNAGVLASLSFIPVTTPGLIGKVPSMLANPIGPVYVQWSRLPAMLPWLWRYLRNSSRERATAIAHSLAPLTLDSFAAHRDLAAGTPAARRVREMGYAFAYRDRAAFDGDAFGWNLRTEHGISYDVYEDDAAREVEPAMGRGYRCLVVSSEQHGTIDEPGNYVKELAEAFTSAGGTYRQAGVASLEVRDGRFAGLKLENGETLAGDDVVLAAGVWSAELLKPLGINIPLQAERGYHVELLGSNRVPRHALSVTDGKFVATPMGDRVRLAGLAEFASIDAPPSKAPVKTLLTRARQIFDDLEYESHTEWLGRRPTTIDSLPVLGELGRQQGIHLAFGHQHVGLTCAPTTARLVVDRIAGVPSNQDMAPYSAERFG